MALILHELGAPVQGVIMIDSPFPTTHDGISELVLRRICQGRPDWLLENFKAHAAMLSAYSLRRGETAPIPTVLLQSVEAVGADVLRDSPPSFLGDSLERQKQIHLWEDAVGPNLRVLQIPGNHFQAFEDAFVGS